MFDPSVPLRNLTLLWEGLPSGSAGWDGFSLLVDDVERFRGTATNFSLALLDQGLPHFFRLAVSRPFLSIHDSLTCGVYSAPQFTKAGDVGDYTNAASLFPNGTWTNPLPGPSY